MDREKNGQHIQKNVQKRVVSQTKRRVKKRVKRTHPLSFLMWGLALLLGLSVGCGACAFLCRNDCFELEGKSELYVEVAEGQRYEYEDKGVRAVSFGRDISRRVKVRSNMTDEGDGVYSFDASEAGVYYLIYTVDDPRLGEIRRVRTIIVGGDA